MSLDSKLEGLQRYMKLKSWKNYVKPLLNIICEEHPSSKIYLIGSLARGTATARSDIDILIVTESPDISARHKARIIKKAIDQGMDEELPVDLHITDPSLVETYVNKGPLILIHEC